MNLRHITTCALLFAALAFAATPAHADRDAVQFGSDIVVPEGSSVHDAVCFFCNVIAKGDIDHDVVVFFGNIHITHHSNHDVVNFFGNVRVDDDGSIEHDLVSFFGVVRLGENVTVGNDVVSMFGGLHVADSASIHGNRVAQPAWVLFVPLMILGGIIALIISQVRAYRRRQIYAAYQYQPPPPPPPQPHP
jgi:hypothetical protein